MWHRSLSDVSVLSKRNATVPDRETVAQSEPFARRCLRKYSPLWRGNSQLLFLFFLDNDAWCDHHHQALSRPTDADVFEESIDVR